MPTLLKVPLEKWSKEDSLLTHTASLVTWPGSLSSSDASTLPAGTPSHKHFQPSAMQDDCNTLIPHVEFLSKNAVWKQLVD